MIDREKVSNGLNHCFHGQECCGDTECPYYIEHLSDSCCLEDCQENLKADTLAMLKEQPDIVRCKDCKYGSIYMTEDVCGETLIECNRPDLGDVEIHGWNWFCAEGKRKD